MPCCITMIHSCVVYLSRVFVCQSVQELKLQLKFYLFLIHLIFILIKRFISKCLQFLNCSRGNAGFKKRAFILL